MTLIMHNCPFWVEVKQTNLSKFSLWMIFFIFSLHEWCNFSSITGWLFIELTHHDRSHRSQKYFTGISVSFTEASVSSCTRKTPGCCWRSCTLRLSGPRVSGCPQLGGWRSDLSSHPENTDVKRNIKFKKRLLSSPQCSLWRCSQPWQTPSSDCSWRRDSRIATRQTSASPHRRHSVTCLRKLKTDLVKIQQTMLL